MPTLVATVRPTDATDIDGADEHDAELADVHAVVPQTGSPMPAVAVGAPGARKCSPLIVTVAPPVVGALATAEAETTGASNENAPLRVPTTALTVTASAPPGARDGGTADAALMQRTWVVHNAHWPKKNKGVSTPCQRTADAVT